MAISNVADPVGLNTFSSSLSPLVSEGSNSVVEPLDVRSSADVDSLIRPSVGLRPKSADCSILRGSTTSACANQRTLFPSIFGHTEPSVHNNRFSSGGGGGFKVLTCPIG